MSRTKDTYAKVFTKSWTWRKINGLKSTDHGVLLQMILRLQTDGYVYVFRAVKRDIAQSMSLGEVSVYRSLKNLADAGVIFKVKNNVYQVHPDLAWVGHDRKRIRTKDEYDETGSNDDLSDDEAEFWGTKDVDGFDPFKDQHGHGLP